jgi:hypothetical protein
VVALATQVGLIPLMVAVFQVVLNPQMAVVFPVM